MDKNWKIKVPSINASPTAALVVALLALVAGLSMPAQAAIERLGNGSVGTAQLKDGAVTTPKLRHGAVTSPKIRDGSVTVGDLSAAAQPKLPRSISRKEIAWAALDTAEGVELARLALPTGRWLVTVKGSVMSNNGGVACNLIRGSVVIDSTRAGSGASWTHDSVYLLAPAVTGGTTVVVTCSGSETSIAGDIVLSAVEVR